MDDLKIRGWAIFEPPSGIFADGKYDFLTDQETWGALQKQILKDQHADSTSCSPWKN
jgi:hypothetical protein